ncbi:MAG TPA: hypothetical protein VG675_10240 [Bryobacteraceae bacterium]|nr:hypothetical protein [Bryobacteraceae bacterium]
MVKAVERDDLGDIADVNLRPAAYEFEAVGKRLGVREGLGLTDLAGDFAARNFLIARDPLGIR